jgi:hypothetical protein
MQLTELLKVLDTKRFSIGDLTLLIDMPDAR